MWIPNGATLIRGLGLIRGNTVLVTTTLKTEKELVVLVLRSFYDFNQFEHPNAIYRFQFLPQSTLALHEVIERVACEANEVKHNGGTSFCLSS